MACDVDYGRRIDLCADLCLQNPRKKMKSLQKEALKYYPLFHKEAIRNWMSWRVGMQIADVANRKAGLTHESV